MRLGLKETFNSKECKEYEIRIDKIDINSDSHYDVFLELNYYGDRAELHEDGKMIADWFTTGLPWRVSLKRLGYPKKTDAEALSSYNAGLL